MTKFCPRCEQTLPVESFVPNTARCDGWSGYCRACMMAYNVEREARLRAAAIALLGGECVRCGITDARVLDIDHPNGGGTRERREGLRQAKFYRHVLGHEADYQLLCRNCNWIKWLEEDRFVTPSVIEPAPSEVQQLGLFTETITGG